ncbi:MAG: hypothetical protein WBF99_12360 [Xanthobacteraceae bacterium]
MGEWTASIVMGRYLEAAATEKFFTADRPSVDRGYWPVFNPLVTDDVDVRGHHMTPQRVWKEVFDDNAREDYLAKWQGRDVATPGQISRHDEALLWTCRIIKEEKLRRIVWVWAFCAITPKRSFAKACDHYGWVRQTAYRRLTRAFERISAKLNNDKVLLRFPDDKWMRQLPASVAHTNGNIAPVADMQTPNSRSAYRTERSSDQPDIRDMSWAVDFAAREAKRRAKLGLDAA